MENYKSQYTELYNNDPEKGKEYEGKLNRKFELFILELEKEILKNIQKDHFLNSKNINYLDFACGTGRILEFFKNDLKLINVTGVDTSEIMLSEARKKAEARFICGNIIEDESLLNNQKFDLITVFRLFLNLEKDNRVLVLKNIAKYLKDDGCIVLNNHINRYSLIGLQFWVRRLLGNKKIINSATQKEFEEMITEAGLHIEKVYKLAFLPGRNGVIFLPWNILKKVELFLEKIPLIRTFSLIQIYVCKKN